MSIDDGNDHDSSNVLPSLTPQRITQQLVEAGHAVPGGIFATEAGVAWLIDCSVRTLRNWRAEKSGPQSVMTTKRLYPIDELAAWLQSRIET